MKYTRSGIHIPLADTIRNDLNDNYNISKETFRRELQVNNLTHNLNFKCFINQNKINRKHQVVYHLR
jgi:hypothetical protein